MGYNLNMNWKKITVWALGGVMSGTLAVLTGVVSVAGRLCGCF
jgi:hypothetical protein